MPNGEVQRGRERRSDVDERLAARPPLQRLVRPLTLSRRPSCLLYRRLPGALCRSFARLLLLLLLACFTRCCRFTCRGCLPYLCLSLYGFSSCRSAFAAAALSVSSHSKQAEPPPAGGRAFTQQRHWLQPAACRPGYLLSDLACSLADFQVSGLTAKFSGATSGTPRWMRNSLRGLRCNAWLGRSWLVVDLPAFFTTFFLALHSSPSLASCCSCLICALPAAAAVLA